MRTNSAPPPSRATATLPTQPPTGKPSRRSGRRPNSSFFPLTPRAPAPTLHYHTHHDHEFGHVHGDRDPQRAVSAPQPVPVRDPRAFSSIYPGRHHADALGPGSAAVCSAVSPPAPSLRGGHLEFPDGGITRVQTTARSWHFGISDTALPSCSAPHTLTSYWTI